MKNKITALIIALSFLAMLLTSYLTVIHYMPSAGSICNISNDVNCDKINKSPHSNFFYAIGLQEMQYLLGFDVPVAIFGFLTYLMLFSLGAFLYINRDFLPNYAKKKYFFAIFMLSFAGFLFSSYLSYIEAFVLKAWCIFCVSQAIIITIILLISIILLRSRQFKK